MNERDLSPDIPYDDENVRRCMNWQIAKDPKNRLSL